VPGGACDAAEEARRAERLARNREAAAVSRARRRAAAYGLDTRCRELETANAQLRQSVARLAAENHALRAHILANCPPPVPPPPTSGATAPAAAPPAPAGTPVPLTVLPPGPLALPVPLPVQKLPLPRIAVAVRPAPAAPRKTVRADDVKNASEDGGKRAKRTAFTAAATVLFSLALISSPMLPSTSPPSLPEGSSMRALAPPAAAQQQSALQVAQPSLLLASNATRPEAAEAELLALATHVASPALANGTAAPPLPQALPLPELPLDDGGAAPFPSDALVSLFSGDAGANEELSAALTQHARWLEDTWRPLLQLPLSDERAIASLKALSIYAGGGGAGRATAALASSSSTAWSPQPQQAAWWLAPTPAPMACRKLFEFSAVDADVMAEADGSDAAPAPAPAQPRALRRLGGAWPLPPTAREAAAAGEGASGRASATRIPAAGAEEVVVSLLEPPPELSFGGASAGSGFGFAGTTQGGGSANSRAVLVVVMLQSAARYLTYSCTM
jgi:hypothetical protein